MVLLGIVPVLMAVPPTTSSFSISATRLPNLAAWMEARCPPGPEPTTMRSYFSMTGGASISNGGRRGYQAEGRTTSAERKKKSLRRRSRRHDQHRRCHCDPGWEPPFRLVTHV